ncbi:hypothetical protein [Brytella acorum]|uniref:Uncharacterized protein n=1 Tax=Brytella acorum TaxID=2959299 RepID=A0AA35UP59_9PROT|nr:hypothetical protein [Brytella acorum]CAI9119572.1 hypothetical protein LMG32879_000389 [Brytella acorum]
MTERNRDFAQVKVGTVVGFDKPANRGMRNNAPYRVHIVRENLIYFNDDKEDCRVVSSHERWMDWRAYIISQPEDERESAEYSKDELVIGLIGANPVQPHQILVVYWEWSEGPHKGARFWAAHSTCDDGRCADWPQHNLRPLGAVVVSVSEGKGLDLIASSAAARAMDQEAGR